MSILAHVGKQIRELRQRYNSGEGISQETLAANIKVTPNTISRWETGVYRPSLEDLEKLARFFAVPIMRFFPTEQHDLANSDQLMMLLRAAKQLPAEDLEELTKFAEFRRARRIYAGKSRPRAGRKGSKHK